jgi:two-component system NarL family sensor kinase/two-component system sensor histidine kinase UhpB
MDSKHAKYQALVKRTVLRIVQEGLANAYRHASALQVSIDIRRLGTRLHIVIADDGRGIPHEFQQRQRPTRAGVGISGMRMRLTQLGGRLRISVPPKGGTRLHAVLPTDD